MSKLAMSNEGEFEWKIAIELAIHSFY